MFKGQLLKKAIAPRILDASEVYKDKKIDRREKSAEIISDFPSLLAVWQLLRCPLEMRPV